MQLEFRSKRKHHLVMVCITAVTAFIVLYIDRLLTKGLEFLIE